MPQQFHQAVEPAPLQFGVPELLAAPIAEETTSAPRYTSDAAKHILDRAARLQADYRETLSQGDIEAIAHDSGIAPEFVRQALAQAKAKQKAAPYSRKRMSRLRLQPLPFHAVAKTALLPILYACLLISITSWQPESGFAKWFLPLYMIVPPLFAFSAGLLRKRIRLSAASGAFWGLGILFAFALPNSIKLHQHLDNLGSAETLQLLSETSTTLAVFLACGIFLGIAGAMTRRGIDRVRKWYGKRRSNRATFLASLRGI